MPTASARPDPLARLSGIDALRGVSALGIVAWHQLGFTVNTPIFGHAYKGVGLFFMISGFVMAAVYEDRLRRGLSAWRFGALRLARLYPLYFAGTLLGFVLALAGLGLKEVGPSEAWKALPAALVFWPGGLNSDSHLFPLDAPGWSLYLELAACLAYAFVLPVLTTRRLAVVVLAGFVLIECQLFAWPNLDGGWNRESFLVGVARVLYAFPAGVLLHRLWRAGRLPSWRPPLWAVCSLFVAIIAIPPGGAVGRIEDLLISAVISPLLVVMAANATYGPRQARVARLLGEPSYALYALHFPVLVAFHRLFPQVGSAPAILAGVVSLAIAWLLATTASRWIEGPARRAIGRRQSDDRRGRAFSNVGRPVATGEGGAVAPV